MRVAAFVHSPMLEAPEREEDGLMHITDVTATILGLAGVESDGKPLDGVNQVCVWVCRLRLG